MGIATEYQACALCDYCGESWAEAFWTQKELIKELRKNGWSIGKTVKCPKCKETSHPPRHQPQGEGETE